MTLFAVCKLVFRLFLRNYAFFKKITLLKLSSIIFSKCKVYHGVFNATATEQQPTNSKFRVLTASLVGTTIEFFDFYIYATAAVIIFPHLFFPASTDPMTATIQSLATFAIAFIARPIGAAFFGHLGDRIGRKATLVAALAHHGDFHRMYWFTSNLCTNWYRCSAYYLHFVV